MKKYKPILLLLIVLFALIMLLSCNRHTCPAYGGRNVNSEYGNIKLAKK